MTMVLLMLAAIVLLAFGAMEIVERRTEELKRIEREGRREKNGFRLRFLVSEYNQRKAELEALEELL